MNRVIEKIASFQEQRANQNSVKAWLRKDDDAERIVELKDDLRAAYEHFTVSVCLT
jgi:hypothetical protein